MVLHEYPFRHGLICTPQREPRCNGTGLHWAQSQHSYQRMRGVPKASTAIKSCAPTQLHAWVHKRFCPGCGYNHSHHETPSRRSTTKKPSRKHIIQEFSLDMCPRRGSLLSLYQITSDKALWQELFQITLVLTWVWSLYYTSVHSPTASQCEYSVSRCHHLEVLFFGHLVLIQPAGLMPRLPHRYLWAPLWSR